MDLIKIGNFIADRRKKQNLTQMELAEKLNITDRAVSKWERGKSLPDASVMLELCKVLNISVNELLTGENLEMKDYNEQAEKNLIEMKKQKELADKRLLTAEIWLGLFAALFLLAVVVSAGIATIPEWAKVLIIIGGLVVFFIVCFYLLRIEQVAGFYECQHCHHRYVPTYKQVNLAMHMGRTRYMKCPKCGKKSWQKKVLSDKE